MEHTIAAEDIIAAGREEYERRRAERQRLGREQAASTVAEKRKAGEAVGVILPPGYRRRWEDGSREPILDPQVAPLVAEAFALRLGGMSLRGILAILTPKGLVSRNGTPMHASSLRAMLTNPFYCGMVRVGGELVPGRHEALVTQETFTRVQRKLSEDRRTGRPRPDLD